MDTMHLLHTNIIKATIAANPTAKPGQLKHILERVKKASVQEGRASSEWDSVLKEILEERSL